MTQEDKRLLLKDLCARLPYGVKVYNTTFKEPTIQTLYGKISSDEFLMEETYTSVGVDGDDFGPFNKRHYTGHIDFIKPYLRPMSSMTDDERKEYNSFIGGIEPFNSDFSAYSKENKFVYEFDIKNYIDWLNAHNFDYRGLIEKGLALEAPKGMYNLKEK